MSSSDSMICINMESNNSDERLMNEAIRNYCAICGKHTNDFNGIKLTYVDHDNINDNLSETSLLTSGIITSNEISLIVHRNCAKLNKTNNFNPNDSVERWSYDNYNSNSDSSDKNNSGHYKKYISNIKNHYIYVIMLLIIIVGILCVILYNCYYIIKAENYLISYGIDECYLPDLFYTIHMVLIINVLVFSFVIISALMRIVLLIFK